MKLNIMNKKEQIGFKKQYFYHMKNIQKKQDKL